MRLTHLLAVGSAALGLAVAGCGGDSDEDQIRGIIDDVAANPTTICEHMGQDLAELIGGREQCEKLAEEDPTAEESTDVDVQSVEIDGDTATATVSTEEDGEDTVTFAKEDGEWKFAEPPGADAEAPEIEAPEIETPDDTATTAP